MGAERNVRRARLRRQYKEFASSWRRERRFQRTVQESGRIAPGTVMLSRCPTFSTWLENVKNDQARVVVERDPSSLQEHLESIQELEWEED